MPVTQTLLDALAEQFPDSSRTTLRQMLQNDRVRVNGAPERDAKRVIKKSDRVEVGPKAPPIDPRVNIVFQDADIIVIDKAAGLLTVPSDEVRHETAETFLNRYLGGTNHDRRVYHVHRLDRDTSGLLVFAKNTHVREKLQRQFAAHNIDRMYIAIVYGKLKEPSGTFRSFLVEDSDLRVKTTGDTRKGKEAITHYRTIKSDARYSLLEVTLETGRRNQIRVHLAEAGHPIVGDTMYGRGHDPVFGRLALHAARLGFTHPGTGQKVSFESPVTPFGLP